MAAANHAKFRTLAKLWGLSLPDCPTIFVLALAAIASILFQPHHSGIQAAYIGPGAGIAFLGSFLTLIAGFFLSVFSLLLWPFRMAWYALRRRRSLRNASVKRIIFLGLDGLDPRVTERMMAEGK